MQQLGFERRSMLHLATSFWSNNRLLHSAILSSTLSTFDPSRLMNTLLLIEFSILQYHLSISFKCSLTCQFFLIPIYLCIRRVGCGFIHVIPNSTKLWSHLHHLGLLPEKAKHIHIRRNWRAVRNIGQKVCKTALGKDTGPCVANIWRRTMICFTFVVRSMRHSCVSCYTPSIPVLPDLYVDF